MKKVIVPNKYDEDQRRLDIAMRFVFKSKQGENMYFGCPDIDEGSPLIAAYDDEKGILEDQMDQIEVIVGGIHVTEKIFLFRTRDNFYLYCLENHSSPFVPSNFCPITQVEAGEVLEKLAPVKYDYEEYVWDLRQSCWPYSGKIVTKKDELINNLEKNDEHMILSFPRMVHVMNCFKSEDGRTRNGAIYEVERIVRRDGKLIAVSLDVGLFAFDGQKYDIS